MKELIFKKELDKFENDDIKEACAKMINLLPDYFFVVPASSTGKYHPLCDMGEGGLVRHTKVTARVCEEYFRNASFNTFDSRKRDLIRMTIILHDGLKNGISDSGNTVINHPLLIADFIKQNENLLSLPTEEIDTITRLVSTHMGPWTKDRNGNEILKAPKEYDELFVHNCDYIASRSFFNFEFENNEIVDDMRIKLEKK